MPQGVCELIERYPQAELEPLEGMLIYPAVGGAIDATFEIHDHRVRIATLDLSLP